MGFDLSAVKRAAEGVASANALLNGLVAASVMTFLKVKIGDRVMGSCGYTSKPVQFQVDKIDAKYQESGDKFGVSVTLSGPVVNKDGSLASVKRGYEYVAITDGSESCSFMQERSAAIKAAADPIIRGAL